MVLPNDPTENDFDHDEFQDAEGENGPRYMDEYQWEEFMQEADKRTDKYIELFEKYQEHPDRDMLIAKEMGWDWLVEALEAEERGEIPESDSEEDQLIDETEEGEEWKQIAGYESLDLDDVKHLPLFQRAFGFGCDAIQLAEGLAYSKEAENCIRAFVEGATVPAAKISGGFAMGFELESLGGNIANCKRGLVAANRCLSALQEMRDKKIIEQENFDKFYRRAKELRDELAVYIRELRERLQRGIA